MSVKNYEKNFQEDIKEIVWHFIKELKTELQNSHISESGYQVLREYYLEWYKNFSKWSQYYYFGRLFVLADLIQKEKIKNVLDIDYGCGSEAILCASLGCRVVGIDLNKERLNCAKERKIYYEKLLNEKLNIEFQI
ncbi:MAG: hypothetical protein ACK413_03310, partial [Patescibacteria group bacterium]